jgi:hypothetical protein
MNSRNEQTKNEQAKRLDSLSGVIAMFKDDEMLLKGLAPVHIRIHGNVTYYLYHPYVWSEAVGQEAFVDFWREDDEQAPDYGIDKVEVMVHPTKDSESEDGTVIIESLGTRTASVFKLTWSDFTDIIAITDGAVTHIYPLNWIYPDELEKPEFKIDVYDESLHLPLYMTNLINKILGEPYFYLSPKLESRRTIVELP